MLTAYLQFGEKTRHSCEVKEATKPQARREALYSYKIPTRYMVKYFNHWHHVWYTYHSSPSGFWCIVDGKWINVRFT